MTKFEKNDKIFSDFCQCSYPGPGHCSRHNHSQHTNNVTWGGAGGKIEGLTLFRVIILRPLPPFPMMVSLKGTFNNERGNIPNGAAMRVPIVGLP